MTTPPPPPADPSSAFLLALSDSLRPLADPAEAQAVACRLLGEHLGVDRSFYVEVADATGTARVRHCHTRAGSPSLAGENRVADFGWAIPPMRRGELLALADVTASPLVPEADRPALAALRIAAHVNAPLVKNGVLVGVLCVTDSRPRVWTAAEVGLVREVGERTWAAVERAKAEAELRRGHATFLGLVRNAPFGVYLVDADFRVAEASVGAEKVFASVRPLFGRDLAEVLRVIWPEPFASEAVARFRHTLASGDPYHSADTTERRHDVPQVESYDWRIARVPLPDGRFGVVCYFYETTELRRAAARDAFRAKLSDALRPLADPREVKVAAAGVLGEHLRVHRAFYAEVEGDDWIVTKGYERGVAPLPDGAYSAARFGRWVMRTYRDGGRIVFRDTQTDPRFTSAERAAHAAAGIRAALGVPLVKGGRLVAILAVHSAAPRDWTADEVGLVEKTAEWTWAAVERAKAEGELRANRGLLGVVAGLGSDWWFTARVEADGTAVTEVVSDGFTRRLGYTPDDLMAAGGWAAVVHPDDRAEAGRQMARLLGGETIEGELRHVARDGRVTWSQYRTRPEVDSGGRVVRVYGVARDITARKLAEDELRRTRDSLEGRVAQRTAELSAALDALAGEMGRRRSLARRLATAQEDERRRVSRDLHDTLGQLQAALALAVAAVRRTPGLPPTAGDQLAEVQRLADTLARETHALAVRLRPTALDDFGLGPTLAQLAADWSARTGVPVQLQSAGLDAGRLPAEVETAVYRMVQESLTNVQKHAGATRVGVTVARPGGQVTVTVEDDGVGFDPAAVAPGRLGLVGMRERVELAGGTLEVETTDGGGTTVFARFVIAGDPND